MFRKKKKEAVPVGEEHITNTFRSPGATKDETETVLATKYSDGTYQPKEGIWAK